MTTQQIIEAIEALNATIALAYNKPELQDELFEKVRQLSKKL